ncbi:S-layer homology domain-containing protein [Paenibacillus sp. MCAF9]|uniref:S-layer homology domain-containing protein n=1 Tax=Paenibacillus sp. MCAF9 TaxID=3233046 RepID=UPI003F98D168
MYKRLVSGFIVGLFFFIHASLTAYADAQLTLNPITDKIPGDAVTISGSTSLKELTVTVLRPNGTVLYADVFNGGNFSGQFTLPVDLAFGDYKVVAGNASTTAIQTFRVVKKETDSGPGPVDPGQPPATSNNSCIIKVVSPEFDAVTGNAKAVISEKKIADALASLKNDEGLKMVVIEFQKVERAVSYSTSIPVKFLNTAALLHGIEIRTEIGTIVISSHMLNSLNLTTTGVAKLTISNFDKSKLDTKTQAEIGNRPVVDIGLEVDDKTIEWNNPDAPVTVMLPYTPTAAELASHEHLVVWFIEDAGTIVSVPSGRYDAASGKVIFKTAHFSKYAIAFVNKTFMDINHYSWAKKSIEVLASKGVINGISDANFAPASSIKRADFILLLVKALGLTASANDNFIDVKPNAYYADAISISKKLDIVLGLGNNEFNPEAPISRQDMITMINRALKVTNQNLAAGTSADLSRFADHSKIASYAEQSVSTLVKNGIVDGDGANINPYGNATRAETAVLIYRIYNL